MKIRVKGIIIRESDLGEKDKVIKIFTEKHGIISAIVKRGKVLKNSGSSIAQPFAYCDFCLYVRKNGYIVDSLEIIELFWNIREDLSSLALTQYFCELCVFWSPDESNSQELLRLLLNTLFYLANKKMNISVLKAIFELRGCSLCGYMPNLVGCVKCGDYEPNEIYFVVENGILICKSCYLTYERRSDYNVRLISHGVLSALRHIIYSKMENLFCFKISEEIQSDLCDICEKYIFAHIGFDFKSLNFYKSLSCLN